MEHLGKMAKLTGELSDSEFKFDGLLNDCEVFKGTLEAAIMKL
jgi:hypothetical protein